MLIGSKQVADDSGNHPRQATQTGQDASQQRKVIDEIQLFQNAPYIGSIEATWGIFGLDLHERFPRVQRLAVHLENGQRVYFNPENAQARAEAPPPEKKKLSLPSSSFALKTRQHDS